MPADSASGTRSGGRSTLGCCGRYTKVCVPKWRRIGRANTIASSREQARVRRRRIRLSVVPSGRELAARGDARLSKEQRIRGSRRGSATAQIRPYRQRGDRRPGACGLLHSSRSRSLDLRSCSSSLAAASRSSAQTTACRRYGGVVRELLEADGRRPAQCAEFDRSRNGPSTATTHGGRRPSRAVCVGLDWTCTRTRAPWRSLVTSEGR
jgi:hypothetical protein